MKTKLLYENFKEFCEFSPFVDENDMKSRMIWDSARVKVDVEEVEED